MSITVTQTGRVRKHFLPLESNPEVFNELLQLLGVTSDIGFEDVFTLDEPQFLPRPALAVVLVFPTTDRYETKKAALESSRPEYTGSGNGEPVVWFKQTINNACGLYAILHALSNGKARQFIKPDSLLHRLLEDSIPKSPDPRAQVLEQSPELEQAHTTVAVKGDTKPPDNPEDYVDFHYVCFARSDADGHLWVLDGDCKGPIDTGIELADSDTLAPEAVEVIRKYIELEDENAGFNIMALVKRDA